jgi:hypothetical protein
MKTWLRVAVLVVIGAAFAVGLSKTGGASAIATPQTETERAPTLAQVERAALGESAESGEPTARSLEETTGTLGQAAHSVDPVDPAPTITDPRTGSRGLRAPCTSSRCEAPLQRMARHQLGAPCRREPS